jgi:hypothetical protein
VAERANQLWVAGPDWEFEGSESVWFQEKFTNWGGGLPITMQQVGTANHGKRSFLMWSGHRWEKHGTSERAAENRYAAHVQI